MPDADDPKDDATASARETLERDTAVNGTPAEEKTKKPDVARAAPAEGGNDVPPPLDGSPKS